VALVVWVFAGGGESEVRGLMLYLEGQYGAHRFIKKVSGKAETGTTPTKGK